MRFGSLAFAGVFVVVLLANVVELTVLRPATCTLMRMQIEAWIFMARAVACVAPLPGLVTGAVAAARGSRTGVVGLTLNAAALAAVFVLFLTPHPSAHMPCLRD